MKLAFLIVVAFLSAQCADFDGVSSLLQAGLEKVARIQALPGGSTGTREAASRLRSVRKRLLSDFHVLEQGLLSGNEGRMSSLIGKLKTSVDAVGGDVPAEESAVSRAAGETAAAVLQVLQEIQAKLQGDPGWTPSWHYISQFLEAFLYNLAI